MQLRKTVNDLNRSCTRVRIKLSLFHVCRKLMLHAWNGKELELQGILDRNRISFLHNCEKGRCEFLVKSFAHGKILKSLIYTELLCRHMCRDYVMKTYVSCLQTKGARVWTHTRQNIKRILCNWVKTVWWVKSIVYKISKKT